MQLTLLDTELGSSPFENSTLFDAAFLASIEIILVEGYFACAYTSKLCYMSHSTKWFLLFTTCNALTSVTNLLVWYLLCRMHYIVTTA